MVLLLSLRQILHMTVGFIKQPIIENKHIVASFRAYPPDLDMFMHVNNAAYLRVGELAAWQLLGPLGFFSVIAHNGLAALVITEQQVTYKKEIKPFQRYEVHTTIRPVENKWLEYTQTFVQQRVDMHKSPTEDKQSDIQPVHYCIIRKRGLVKTLKGKTIKPEELAQCLQHFE